MTGSVLAGPPEPDVSVIIPAYGDCPHLDGLLHDLAAQTTPPKEVIVAHSGTDDPTEWIALAHPSVTVLRSDTRWLPGAARNAGVAHASCKWLAFADSDLRIGPNWLSSFLSVATDGGERVLVGALDHGRSDGYWGRVLWFIEFGSVHPYRRGHEMASAPGANLFLTRSLFERSGGFPAHLLVAEDAHFCVATRQAGAKLQFVPAAVARHQCHDDPAFVLARLGALGRGAAEVRCALALPGHQFARAAPLGLALWPVRVGQIVFRVVRNRGPVGKVVVHLPGITIGLFAWTVGFLGGSRWIWRSR